MEPQESLARTFKALSLETVVSANGLEAAGAVWNHDKQCWGFPDGSCGNFMGATAKGPRFEPCTHSRGATA